MNVEITYTEQDLKRLVMEDIQRKLGDVPFDEKKVVIETKSKQNFKSEWESAAFRASYTHVK